jgi:non-ribosomal peptide synthetase component F
VDLTADRTRPAERDAVGALLAFTVPADTAKRAAELARSRATTPFAVLLAAFEVLVGQQTGQPDFAVGVPVSGRTHPDTERLVGHFVNTVVLRSDLAGEPDFTKLVDRVRATVTGALAHQDVPFGHLVRELRPARDLSRNPLIQVMFAYQTGLEEDWRLDGLEVTVLPTHTRTSKFDLLLSLRERPDGTLAGSVEYPVELFDEETVRRLADSYVAVLHQAVGE